MKVTDSELIYQKEQKYVRATIFSSTTPNPMPKPEDIEGLDNTWKFYPDSLLIIDSTGDAYLAGEDGLWHKQ